MKKFLGALLSLFLLNASTHAADKIRIGIPTLGALFITFPLAQKKGFLKEEGLEAELIRIFGTVAIAALVNAELDYWTAIGFSVRSAIQGIPVKVVAGYLPIHPSVLIGRPEIKSVKDLKGKTLGVSVFGGAPDIIARMIVKHFGLDPEKDIKVIATGATETRLAAMQQGLIAATVVTVPTDIQGIKMGFHALARTHELFSYPDAGLTASVKKIRERPDEIKRVIRAGLKANRYILRNREATIQFMMEWQKVNRDIATATYDSLGKMFSEDGTLPEKGLRLVIEENKKIAKVERGISFDELADFSFLREAQRN